MDARLEQATAESPSIHEELPELGGFKKGDRVTAKGHGEGTIEHFIVLPKGKKSVTGGTERALIQWDKDGMVQHVDLGKFERVGAAPESDVSPTKRARITKSWKSYIDQAPEGWTAALDREGGIRIGQDERIKGIAFQEDRDSATHEFKTVDVVTPGGSHVDMIVTRERPAAAYTAHYDDYTIALNVAQKMANSRGHDIAIRKVKEFGKEKFTVASAAKNDSDYARAEIVSPETIPPKPETKPAPKEPEPPKAETKPQVPETPAPAASPKPDPDAALREAARKPHDVKIPARFDKAIRALADDARREMLAGTAPADVVLHLGGLKNVDPAVWDDLEQQGLVERRGTAAEPSYFVKPKFAQALYRNWRIHQDATEGYVPVNSEAHDQRPKVANVTVDSKDPRYSMLSPDGRQVFKTLPDGTRWTTNGYWAMQVPDTLPKFAAKVRYLDSKDVPDKPYPRVEEVIPKQVKKDRIALTKIGFKAGTDRPAGSRSSRDRIVFEASGTLDTDVREGKKSKDYDFGADGRVWTADAGYVNGIEGMHPGGEWAVYPKENGAFGAGVYEVGGKIKAVLMPVTSEEGVDAAGIKASIASSLEGGSTAPTEGEAMAQAEKGARVQALRAGMDLRKKAEKTGKSKQELADEKAPKTRQGTGPKGVGAASGPEMARARRRERQLQVEDARRMGIGAPILTQAQVEERSEARLAAAAGKPVRRQAGMAATAVDVPKEGLPFAELERAIIGKHGEIDDAKAAVLGQESIPQATWDGLTRGEQLVHVSRRVMAARNPKHLENILGSTKYKVWDMPKADQESLAVQVGRRMNDAGEEAIPPNLRDTIQRMDAGEERGVASGASLTKGQGVKWVFSLFPARRALRGLGILEGPTGLRSSYEGMKREWNYWMHYGDRELFRNDKDGRIKLNTKDDEIVFNLGDNPEGHELHVERPEVTMQDGSVVQPKEYHRIVARRLRKIMEEFADRQGLDLDKRQKFYMSHILDRMLALEKQTPKDVFAVHTAAKAALGKEYDADKLNEKLAGVSRAKTLQILDALKGKRGLKTMKGLQGRIDTILGAEERAGIPDELYQPFLKKREGGTPYKHSALLVYEAYTRYALRKIHLEPAVDAARPILEALQGKGASATILGAGFMSQREYGEQMLNRVLGRPGGLDLALNMMTEKLNEATSGRLMKVPVLWRLFKPNLATRTATTLTKIQFLRLLGFAADSAITNVTQGVNTWARFGLPRTVAAYARLADPRFWKTLRQEHLLSEFTSFFAGPTPPWQHPLNLLERVALSPFTAAEFINRGAAFAAALSEAQARGMSFDQSVRLGLGAQSEYLMNQTVRGRKFLEHPFGAIGDRVFGAPTGRGAFYSSEAGIHAREAVIHTQFGYSPVESSPVIGTPIGRTLFQFWSYPTQQGAFLMDGATQAWRSGQYGQFTRFLALLGATVTAPFWGPLAGQDMKNFWSIWSLFPRDFGPTAKIAYWLFQAGVARAENTVDADTERKLQKELYTGGYGFRYFDKASKYGSQSALPFHPVAPPKGGSGHHRTYAYDRFRR